MRFLRIIAFSFLVGVLATNVLALVVWARDPSAGGMDIPTVVLALVLSLTWPVSLFGDFVASSGIAHKSIDILIAVGIVGGGYVADKIIVRRFTKKNAKTA